MLKYIFNSKTFLYNTYYQKIKKFKIYKILNIKL